MRRGSTFGIAGLALGTTLLILGPGTPACAAPPPGEPTVQLSPEAEKEWARVYEEGRKAATARQWERARVLYLEAWSMKRHLTVGASLGRTEVEAGKFRDGAEHLTWALEREADLGAADRKTLRAYLELARARVGALNIVVDPPGAEVLVNGRSVGIAPLPGPVFVDPGPVIVEARLEGYAAARESRVAGAGKDDEVRVALRKEAVLRPLPPDARTRRRSLDKITIAGIAITSVVGAVGIASAIAIPLHPSQKGDTISAPNVAFWGLLGAGALGTATAIYALKIAPNSQMKGATPALTVSCVGSGVQLSAQW